MKEFTDDEFLAREGENLAKLKEEEAAASGSGRPTSQKESGAGKKPDAALIEEYTNLLEEKKRLEVEQARLVVLMEGEGITEPMERIVAERRQQELPQQLAVVRRKISEMHVTMGKLDEIERRKRGDVERAA